MRDRFGDATGLGVGYLVSVFGWVILPAPLKWWPFAITTVIGLVALAGAIGDARERVRDAQAQDLDKSLAYLDAIRKADVDHEWDHLLNAVDADRPLGTPTPWPERLRTVSSDTTTRLAHSGGTA